MEIENSLKVSHKFGDPEVIQTTQICRQCCSLKGYRSLGRCRSFAMVHNGGPEFNMLALHHKGVSTLASRVVEVVLAYHWP
jgi:hypothetical protein